MAKRARKAAKTAKKGARKKAVVKEIKLGTWIKEIRALHSAADPKTAAGSALAAASAGACMLKNPNGGGKVCIQTTRAACKAMGGTYRGGTCGG